MTTITLEPAPAIATLSARASHYLIQLAKEIAEDLPSIAVVVRYGRGAGEQFSVNDVRDSAELF